MALKRRPVPLPDGGLRPVPMPDGGSGGGPTPRPTGGPGSLRPQPLPPKPRVPTGIDQLGGAEWTNFLRSNPLIPNNPLYADADLSDFGNFVGGGLGEGNAPPLPPQRRDGWMAAGADGQRVATTGTGDGLFGFADRTFDKLTALNEFLRSQREDRRGNDDDGGSGTRAPTLSIYDLMRMGQTDLFGSQLQGFEENRDLVDELGVLREEGLASDEQFAEDTAEGREGFLTELDSSRAESEATATISREFRKAQELSRQKTQFDDALRANGVDVSTAASRLEMIGIAPGDFAADAQSETTAMLHSQNMSSANLLNQMDMVAQASAQFATNANDQASSAAMFGIGEDLTFAMQSIDQMRGQGMIDDALALQAISDAERQAGEAYGMAMSNINVQALQAAQAAQAAASRAAESRAAKDRKLTANAASLGIITDLKNGIMPDSDGLYAMAEGDFGDEYLDYMTETLIDAPAGNLTIDQFIDLGKAQLAAEAAGNDPLAGMFNSVLAYSDPLPDDSFDPASASGLSMSDLTGMMNGAWGSLVDGYDWARFGARDIWDEIYGSVTPSIYDSVTPSIYDNVTP